MYKTQTQIDIENLVSDNRGYDRRNTDTIPFNLMDKEMGLQVALANMDVVDSKLGLYDILGFSSRLDMVLKKFNNSGISLYSVTSPDGFKAAIDSAYIKNENILNYESLFPPKDQIDRLLDLYHDDDKTPPDKKGGAAA